MEKVAHKDFIGKIYKTNESGDCFIVDIKSYTDVTVMFFDGYYRKVLLGNLTKGKVKNPFFIGNRIYSVGVYDLPRKKNDNVHTKIVTLWNNMLKRCYDTKFHKRQATYSDATVCTDWLVFSKFKEDIISMENFDKVISDSWQLDKDLIKLGNKEYSKDKCCFVPPVVNQNCVDLENAFTKSIGWYKLPHGTYRACLGEVGKTTTHIGCFKTSEEAQKAYRDAKARKLLRLIDCWAGRIDNRVILNIQSVISKYNEGVV